MVVTALHALAELSSGLLLVAAVHVAWQIRFATGGGWSWW